MQPITAADCSPVDESSDLVETTSCLEGFIIGVQPDKTSTLFASSHEIVFLQMSCKVEDTKELANKENKQFDPGE